MADDHHGAAVWRRSLDLGTQRSFGGMVTVEVFDGDVTDITNDYMELESIVYAPSATTKRVAVEGWCTVREQAAAAEILTIHIMRGTGTPGTIITGGISSADLAASTEQSLYACGIDSPATTAATTYTMWAITADGANVDALQGGMRCREVDP